MGTARICKSKCTSNPNGTPLQVVLLGSAVCRTRCRAGTATNLSDCAGASDSNTAHMALRSRVVQHARPKQLSDAMHFKSSPRTFLQASRICFCSRARPEASLYILVRAPSTNTSKAVSAPVWEPAKVSGKAGSGAGLVNRSQGAITHVQELPALLSLTAHIDWV